MSKGKKFKAILALLIFVVGTACNIYFSTVLHQILSSERAAIVIPTVKDCLFSLLENQNHMRLFLALEILVLLGGLAYYITNDKPYQSDLVAITPKISTPVAAGQKQFGSAKWMKEEERDKAFEFFTINKRDNLISYLLSTGYEDLGDLEEFRKMDIEEEEVENHRERGEQDGF